MVKDEKPSEKPAEDAAAPGVAPVMEVVETAAVAAVETDGHAVHSTGKAPDGGEKSAEVADRVREGVPETPRPALGTELLATPGGYQVVPSGVDPEQVGVNQVSRVAE